MLTTTDADRSLRSRPMAYKQGESDSRGELWSVILSSSRDHLYALRSLTLQVFHSHGFVESTRNQETYASERLVQRSSPPKLCQHQWPRCCRVRQSQSERTMESILESLVRLDLFTNDLSIDDILLGFQRNSKIPI